MITLTPALASTAAQILPIYALGAVVTVQVQASRLRSALTEYEDAQGQLQELEGAGQDKTGWERMRSKLRHRYARSRRLVYTINAFQVLFGLVFMIALAAWAELVCLRVLAEDTVPGGNDGNIVVAAVIFPMIVLGVLPAMSLFAEIVLSSPIRKLAKLNISRVQLIRQLGRGRGRSAAGVPVAGDEE